MSTRTQKIISVWLQRLEHGERHFERHGQQWIVLFGPAPTGPATAIERERQRERYRLEKTPGPQCHPQMLPMQTVVARLAAVERGDAWFTLADVADQACLPMAVVIQARRGRMSPSTQLALSRAVIALGD